MKSFEFQNLNDRFIITIDKSSVSEDFIINLMNSIKVESLVKKADLNEDFINELSEKVKTDWWEKNKERILKMIHVQNNS
jgi:hypothetical protein